MVRRLLAIALIVAGHSRAAAARHNGMERHAGRLGPSLQSRWRGRIELACQPGTSRGAGRGADGGVADVGCWKDRIRHATR